jgi:hypothetical protein
MAALLALHALRAVCWATQPVGASESSMGAVTRRNDHDTRPALFNPKHLHWHCLAVPIPIFAGAAHSGTHWL